jgi:hypothetical protein
MFASQRDAVREGHEVFCAGASNGSRMPQAANSNSHEFVIRSQAGNRNGTDPSGKASLLSVWPNVNLLAGLQPRREELLSQYGSKEGGSERGT